MAYTNEQVCSTLLARRLRQLDPGPNCSAAEHQACSGTLTMCCWRRRKCLSRTHCRRTQCSARQNGRPPSSSAKRCAARRQPASLLPPKLHRLCMPLSQSAPGSPPQLTLQRDPHSQAPPQHIPAWLPALPDQHTYQATPSFAGHDTDAKRQRIAATKAKRQVQLCADSLRNMQCQAWPQAVVRCAALQVLLRTRCLCARHPHPHRSKPLRSGSALSCVI